MSSNGARRLLVIGLLLVGLHAGAGASLAASADGYPAHAFDDAPMDAVGPVLAGGALGPQPAAAQQPRDVRFTVLDVASDFGPESYKGSYAAGARDPDSAENATTNWDTVLGHRIVFTIEIEGDAMDLSCDDRFVAIPYIQTTGGRLYGWTNSTFATTPPTGPGDLCVDGLPGVRIYEVVFDLDGAPPTVTGSLFPALLPGFYIATLELYHHVTPSATNPSGRGPLAGVSDTGFLVAAPELRLSEDTMRFPDRTLRMLTSAGGHGGHPNQYLMPIRPLDPSGEWTLTIDFPGIATDTRFTRVDHYAYRLVPGANLPSAPPTGTPLDPLVEKVEEQPNRLVQVERVGYTLTPDRVPDSKRMEMPLRGSDFRARTETTIEYRPLTVVTILVPATPETYTTGAESIVIPVTDKTYPLRELSPSTLAPNLETTHILLQDSARETGGPTGTNAGDAWALRIAGAGHDAITRSILTREASAQWVEGELRHLDFPQETPRYRLLIMLYGPLDEFLGYRLLERGVQLTATDARFVEGGAGEIELTLTNTGADLQGGTASDVFEMRVTLTASGLPDGRSYEQNITLGGGETRVIRVPVSATSPGDYRVTFTATSGEIQRSTESMLEVISRERAREEARRWYHIPTVELAVFLALLAAAGIAVRRRV
jgi:hypothetical protein